MSILSGGSRAYALDLDLIKSTSPSLRSSSSSPSSTLSENSNSALTISTKRARTPRKRPNQSYSEAAALLSTIYPNLFSTKNLHKLTKHSKPFSSLTPYSIHNEVSLLIENPTPRQKPSFRFEFKPTSPSEKSCIDYQEPSSPELSDYDVESILEEEIGEGIDSIIGNLSIENCEFSTSTYASSRIGSFMGFGITRNCIGKAIRGARNGDWWRPTTQVAVRDIVPQLNAMPNLEKKKKKKSKKKKKVEKEEVKIDTEVATKAVNGTKSSTNSVVEELKGGLGLKLNHEVVLEAWSDREFPITSQSGTLESSADILARLSDIDLLPENENRGKRGASMQRYKEKRKNRLISSNSKKIRYQVRKVNADCRPRMKASGRFVKRPDLLQDKIEVEKE